MVEEKAALRAQMGAQLAALTKDDREKSDGVLFARFLALPQVERAKTILLYCGMGAEPDTAQLIAPLLDRGKTVALPRCLPERRMEARTVSYETVLVRHAYGMLEPGLDCPLISKEKIDLILAPGLAFDQKGFRLGRGGGYYDRYLADFQGQTVALCRQGFCLTQVPTQPHDRPVDLVITG